MSISRKDASAEYLLSQTGLDRRKAPRLDGAALTKRRNDTAAKSKVERYRKLFQSGHVPFLTVKDEVAEEVTSESVPVLSKPFAEGFEVTWESPDSVCERRYASFAEGGVLDPKDFCWSVVQNPTKGPGMFGVRIYPKGRKIGHLAQVYFNKVGPDGKFRGREQMALDFFNRVMSGETTNNARHAVDTDPLYRGKLRGCTPSSGPQPRAPQKVGLAKKPEPAPTTDLLNFIDKCLSQYKPKSQPSPPS